jgi:hypothetical protein
MGVNSTWAGSDQPSGLIFTPMASEVIFQTLSSAGHPHPSSILHRVLRFVPLECWPKDHECDPSHPEDCCSKVCVVTGDDETIDERCGEPQAPQTLSPAPARPGLAHLSYANPPPAAPITISQAEPSTESQPSAEPTTPTTEPSANPSQPASPSPSGGLEILRVESGEPAPAQKNDTPSTQPGSGPTVGSPQ